MASSAKPNAIADLLAQEVGVLQAFIALLQNEQRLLAAGPSEGLAALAAEKSRTAVELGRLSAARDGELVRIGLPDGRAGMDAWTLTDAGAPSQTKWDRLIALASEARALNDANGKAIALHLQHNQQALSLLMAATDRAATYGPDGQAKAGIGGRSLGSA